MEKCQTAGRLVIWRPCPVVTGENFLSTLYTGSAKLTTFEFFHLLEALERELWSYLGTMSGCVIERFPNVKALSWLRTLYTRFARNIKFEILGCLEALEDVNKCRKFSYKYFWILKNCSNQNVWCNSSTPLEIFISKFFLSLLSWRNNNHDRATVEPRLSGLFEYPDFFLWPQFFHEY